jgi:hypothetical protein
VLRLQGFLRRAYRVVSGWTIAAQSWRGRTRALSRLGAADRSGPSL